MTENTLRLSRRTILTGAAAVVFAAPHSTHASGQPQPAQSPGRLRFMFSDQDFTATLNDTPSARDLLTLMPLTLTIRDYSTNEKIADLPRRLTEDGSQPFGGEALGDLCYYAPWGNLALFHGSYRWSRGLIRLGKLDQGPEPLYVRGTYPLRIERLP